MAKGVKVSEGSSLVAYNAKLEQRTKELLSALVQAGGLDSQRELIEKMVALYARENPEVAAKAIEILKMTKGWEV